VVAVRVRVAVLGLACHNYSPRSVGSGPDLRNHRVSMAVGVRRSGDVIFPVYVRTAIFSEEQSKVLGGYTTKDQNGLPLQC